MKALVTGGAGFIGSHVVKSLLNQGIEVSALILPGEKTTNIDGLSCKLIEGNVLDRKAMKKAVQGCTWVFHLAAIYALWLKNPDIMLRVNVQGTKNVLDACAESNVKKIVYTSSIAVFGGQGLNFDATEESPPALLKTGNLYAKSKILAHRAALEYVARGLDISIVAPCGPIGPGDIGPTPTGNLLLSFLNFPVAFYVQTINNMVDVRDVATGHLLAAQKGKTGESYLLGNENLTPSDMTKMISETTGVNRPAISFPIPVAMAAGWVWEWWAEYISHKQPLVTASAAKIAKLGLRADCTKAFKELGLPRRPATESIRDALIWFADQGYIKNPAIRRRIQNI